MPYGTKSPETVTRYSLEAARHLMSRNIKMLVVACNTATAAALPVLREALPIPVLGVVEPGARAAVERTSGYVGVIATEGTVRSKAANTHVAREIAEVYLEPLIDAGIDTLVLGCTHYPILRGTIEQVVGDQVTIVDSAETTALAVREASGISHGLANLPHMFLVTDATERFRKVGEFLDQEIERLELVTL